MLEKKRSLGRGLTELGLSELLNVHEDNTSNSHLKQQDPPPHTSLLIQQIRPDKNQPRIKIEKQGLEELADSIAAQGIIQPIIVRPMDTEGYYVIIAGERRWRAAQLAGLKKVPVIIRELTDDEAIIVALIENIQREDLNPIETAMAFKRLSNQGTITHSIIASLVGKSRSAVTNFLRLLNLEDPVKQMLASGELDMGHARALLALTGNQQIQAAKTIAKKALSVRAAETFVQQLQKPIQTLNPIPDPLSNRLQVMQDSLARQLKTHVKIKPNQNRKGLQSSGQLIIKYDNIANLEAIMELLQTD